MKRVLTFLKWDWYVFASSFIGFPAAYALLAHLKIIKYNGNILICVFIGVVAAYLFSRLHLVGHLAKNSLISNLQSKMMKCLLFDKIFGKNSGQISRLFQKFHRVAATFLQNSMHDLSMKTLKKRNY